MQKRRIAAINILLTLVMALTACITPKTNSLPSPVAISTDQPTVIPTATKPGETPEVVEVQPTPTLVPEPTVIPMYQYIAGGEFLMGSKETDTQAKEDEIPEHTVILPGFWIMTNEMTNAEYAACVATGKCTEPAKAETGPKSQYADPAYQTNPVVGVTWKQANNYCKSLNNRLPTEAEWEKAARGNAGNTYPWGTTANDCSLANTNGCKEDTLAVGSYEAGTSHYGVRDMAGNVREWVSDSYNPKIYQTAKLFQTTGNEKGSLKVVRGGSYKDTAQDTRSAARFGVDPGLEFEDVGFRCVVDSKAYTPFCQAKYRSFCQPPTGDIQPNECSLGAMSGKGGISAISFSCPDAEKVGILDVTTSKPTSGISAKVNDLELECTASDKTDKIDKMTYQCKGEIPESGTSANIQICLHYGIGLNLETGDQLVSCSTFRLPISVGDTVAYKGRETNPYFNTGIDLRKESEIKSTCPQGYIWDSQVGGCVLDLENKDKTVMQKSESCPTGYDLDLNLNCCVPGSTVKDSCEAGNFKDEAGLCIPILQNGCAVGYTYDPYIGCIQQPELDGAVASGCPAGTQISPDGLTCLANTAGELGALTCPGGLDYVQGHGCVLRTAAENPTQCQAGTYLDEKSGECLPTAGPWTGCPANYMINSRSACCVPVPGKENSACLTRVRAEGETTTQDTSNIDQYYQLGQPDCPKIKELVCDPAYHPGQDGTSCVPNSECPKGTGPTPENPFGCFPAGSETCPEGYTMTDAGFGCIPTLTSGTTTFGCSTSQYFDPKMGACLDRAGDCCAQGFYFDKNVSGCVPYPVDQNCPAGFTKQGDTCVSALFTTSNCFTYSLTVPKCPELVCGKVVCSRAKCPLECCQLVNLRPTFSSPFWACMPK
jgi:formylglycine-generating enzyme required for sulfatase activity